MPYEACLREGSQVRVRTRLQEFGLGRGFTAAGACLFGIGMLLSLYGVWCVSFHGDPGLETLEEGGQVAEEFDIDRDTTAAEVCARHVKPMAAAAGTSLVALLQHVARAASAPPWVGAPTEFISYAWSYPYLTLVDIVEQYEAEFPPAAGTANYYFFDQFSLNQHKFVDDKQKTVTNPHAERPDPQRQEAQEDKDKETKEMQRQIVDALRTQMLKSGHVLMCLWPWYKPVPLQRAWCLFELWVALDSGIDLTMCFGASDADALRAAITAGSFDVGKIVGDIRAQDAGAMKAQDKQLILGLIEGTTGIDEFNRLVQAHMLQCMGDTMTTVLARAHARGGLTPHARLRALSMRRMRSARHFDFTPRPKGSGSRRLGGSDTGDGGDGGTDGGNGGE
eukprot:g3154.t1